MSRSSRNSITVSISLQYFKSKNMHFIVTKNGLFRLHKCLMRTTIIESHCIDEGLMHAY